MKKLILAMWILSVALAFWDLEKMAGDYYSPEIFFSSVALISIYSLPFLLIYQNISRIEKFLGDQLVYFYIVLMVAFSLFLPCIRFLPDYRSDALEGLKYLFGPIIYQGGFTLAVFSLKMLIKK